MANFFALLNCFLCFLCLFFSGKPSQTAIHKGIFDLSAFLESGGGKCQRRKNKPSERTPKGKILTLVRAEFRQNWKGVKEVKGVKGVKELRELRELKELSLAMLAEELKTIDLDACLF